MRLPPFLAGPAVALAATTAFAAPPSPTQALPTSTLPSGALQVPADQVLTTALPDGVVVTFAPGTTGRWGTPGKLAGETAKWTRGFHVELGDGEMDVTMPVAPKGEHAFLVSTRAGSLTDWRGRMHVTARGDATAVAVYDGALIVSSSRQTFPVNAAAAIVLHRGGDADKSRTIPGVPSWEDPNAGASSVAVIPEGTGAMLGLAWGAAAGASSYRVQIARDAAMSQIVEHEAVDQPRLSVPAPGAGAHSWAQVRAVGADGIVGPWSSPRALGVLHYRLPSGAFVARDGAVVLPEGASLSLTDGHGLEVAYENVRPGSPPAPPVLYWAKVSGPLRPAEDAPVRVAHLRDASLGVETRVVLAHRQLRADVVLQPRQARAQDPIDVRAVVWDPSGRVDVPSESVTLEAMLDLDPLAVSWQHVSDGTRTVFTARIPPRHDRGPAVVRVVVKDSLGQEIGRGFVEIAGTIASPR
jgi:hypothetical protein